MNGNIPTFYIKALGCKVSQYDAAELRRELEIRGFKINNKEPKVIIINTCAVTKAAMRKDRQAARRLQKVYPSALLVIMGCWPQAGNQAEQEMSDSSIIFWGVGRIKELADKISSVFKEVPNRPGQKNSLVVSSDRSRYFLKIGDGCNQFCAYCLIPYVRGRLQSRPEKEILNEAAAAIAAGYQEIVLSGIHLGLYGSDLKSHYSLNLLLNKLLALPGTVRYRLSSIEVTEVDDELIALMAASKGRLCRHLHISLQSGSDEILKAMRRPYDGAYFAERVRALRKAMPEIAITTDVIVGFPGETEADFEDTLQFAERLAFAKIHVFSFSAHEQTVAFKLPGKVSPAEIKRRSERLRALSAVHEEAYREYLLARYAGQNLFLVMEKKGGDYASGHSEFYPIFRFKKKLFSGLRAGQAMAVETKYLS